LYRYSKCGDFKVKNKEALRTLFDHIITDSKKEMTKEQQDVLEACGCNDFLYQIVVNSTGRKSKMLDFIETNNKFIFNMIKFNSTWELKYATDALKSAGESEKKRAFVLYHFEWAYQGSAVELFNSFVNYIESK
jgi:hypothetical protein